MGGEEGGRSRRRRRMSFGRNRRDLLGPVLVWDDPEGSGRGSTGSREGGTRDSQGGLRPRSVDRDRERRRRWCLVCSATRTVLGCE